MSNAKPTSTWLLSSSQDLVRTLNSFTAPLPPEMMTNIPDMDFELQLDGGERQELLGLLRCLVARSYK
jgi:hypothetical protein